MNSSTPSPDHKTFGAQPRQQGFTLVEIMVALTIGLVMTAGIVQITQANKASNRLVRNLSFVQENMRTAMELLRRDVRRAGFFAINGVPVLIPPPALDRNNTIDGSENGAASDNDTITVVYASDPRYFNGEDCLGQALPAGITTIRNTYFIRDQRLMCEGNGNPNQPQPLVDGVEALQILYGENTLGDPRSANKYVRADQVTNMSNVVSVRIAMRFRSRANVNSAIDTNQYALLDEGASAAPNDRLLRREITTTISLRNTP